MMNKRERTRAKRFTENNKVLTRVDLGKCNKHCFASRMEAKDFSRVNKLDQRAYFCKLHKSWHLTKGLSTFVRDVANDKLLSVIPDKWLTLPLMLVYLRRRVLRAYISEGLIYKHYFNKLTKYRKILK